jgi:hypothetical protein
MPHAEIDANCLLPGENPSHFAAFLQSYCSKYQPQDPNSLELVTELASLRWRLRRFPSFEAQLVSTEIHRLQHDEQLAPLTVGLSESEVLALAFTRLMERKVLQTLYLQEARLHRRAETLARILITMTENQPSVTPARIAAVDDGQPIRVTPQPGRNASCPCGSGQKFKRCCLNRPQSVESQRLRAA